MISHPIVSVIMSVYKEPIDWLKQSIDSILNQTFHDFEFIIICDNPAYTEVKTLLEEYRNKDERIVIIYNEENIGLTKSLNKGLEVSKGDFIARMDADDISVPKRLEKQIKFLSDHPEVGVCGSNISYFGSQKGENSYPPSMDDVHLFLESCFAHPTVLIRRQALGANRYNEKCIVSQDYNLWVDLFEQGVIFANIQEFLLNYRYSSQQIMSTKNDLQIKTSQEIRRKAIGVYYKKSNREITYDISNWQFDYANVLIRDLVISEKSVRSMIWYYSFLSVDKSLLWLLYTLILRGYLFRIPFIDSARLLYFKIKGVRMPKF